MEIRQLLELEEKKSTEKPQPEQIAEGDSREQLKQLEDFKEKEKAFLEEIEKLNNQIEYLKTEINNLKEVGSGTSEERLKQIQEKIKALVSWENVLRIKEESLNQKELELDRQYEAILKVQETLEGKNMEGRKDE